MSDDSGPVIAWIDSLADPLPKLDELLGKLQNPGQRPNLTKKIANTIVAATDAGSGFLGKRDLHSCRCVVPLMPSR